MAKTRKAAGGHRPGGAGSDGFVLIAMAVVSAAIGSGVYLHLGAGKLVGIAFALSAYALFFKLHKLRSASLKTASLDAEVRRLESELERAKAPATVNNPQGAAPVMASSRPVEAAGPVPSAPAAPAPSNQAPRASGPAAQQDEEELGLTALRDFWAYRPSDPVPPMPSPSASHRVPPMVTAAAHPARPAALAARPAPPSSAAPAAAPQEEQRAPASEASALREADVELIQGLIKKLADEVNAAEVQTAATPAASGSSTSTAPQASDDALASLSRPFAAVDASVDALRATAETMREAAARAASQRLAEMKPRTMANPAPAPQPQEELPGAAPPPVRQGHLRLAAIADAVHSGRIDVMLEPVLGLGDLRAKHYEVSIRLLDPAGGTIEADAFDPALSGTSILPLLDRTRIERASGVAHRLAERGKTGAIFSDYSGEAITDVPFLTEATRFSSRPEATRSMLVLTFAQADVRNLSDAQWRALAELKTMGFRFAIGDVTDLDMDFERLNAAGFGFVKLDAAVFLEGLHGPHGTVPAGDICGYLARLGFALIAGHIDSELERSRLFGFGVLFGQGQLFGGPRPMRADALTAARTAAA